MSEPRVSEPRVSEPGGRVAKKTDVVVRACPGGPLLVRGDVTVLDDEGNPVPLHRRTVALCRCGASALLPLCDGTHRSLPASRRP